MRDELDKTLHDKLHGHLRQPSAELWSRIVSDLPAAEILSAADGVSRGRRLFPVLWRSTAAAAVVAAIVLCVDHFWHGQQDADLSAVMAPSPQLYMPLHEVVAIDTEGVESGLMAFHAAPQASNGRSAVRPFKSPLDQNLTPESPFTGEPDHGSGQPEGSDRPAPAATGQQSGSGNNNRPQHPGADNRYGTGTAYPPHDYYNPHPSSARRSRRLAASIFADNLGGTDGSGQNSILQGTYQITEVITRADKAAMATIEPPTPTSTRHRVPLSFGGSVAFDISPRISIETGLTYTYLRSDYEAAGYMVTYNTTQELHYLGVPVAVIYRFANTRVVDFYLRGGVMVERGIAGTSHLKVSDSQATSEVKLTFGGVQPSMNASVGLEFKLIPSLGLYVEPGVSYYPSMSDQPPSYRTENPITMSIRAGFRVNIGNKH